MPKREYGEDLDVETVDIDLSETEAIPPGYGDTLIELLGPERAVDLIAKGGVVRIISASSWEALDAKRFQEMEQWFEFAKECRKARDERVQAERPSLNDIDAIDEYMVAKFLQGDGEFRSACRFIPKADLLDAARRFGSKRRSAQNCDDATRILHDQLVTSGCRKPTVPSPGVDV